MLLRGTDVLVEEFHNGLLQLGPAHVLHADDALWIKHEDAGERKDAPSRGDWPIDAAVPPASPGDVARCDGFLQVVDALVRIDAHEREGAVLEFRLEGAFV